MVNRIRHHIVLYSIFTCALFMFVRIAHAATDPIVTADTATDAGWQLVQMYGPLWGGALLLHGLLGAFLRAKNSTHWIGKGRVLALISGAFATLGAVLMWHFKGTPSAGILVTAVGALQLVWHPLVKPTPVPEASQEGKNGPTLNGQAGFVTFQLTALLMVVGTVLVALLSSGCTAAERQAGVARVATGIVTAFDCEAAHFDAKALEDAKHRAGEELQHLIQRSAPGDLTALRDAFRVDLAPIRDDFKRCAFTGALAALFDSAPVRLTGTLVAENGALSNFDAISIQLTFQAAAREVGWPAVKVAGKPAI